MTVRERILNREVQRYDPTLRCRLNGGRYVVYRIESHYPRRESQVIALTDTWGFKGTPIECGVLNVIGRLREIDQWNSGLTLKDIHNAHEAKKESKLRSFRTTTEGILSEMRPSFAKATSDINTSTLEKLDKRRIEDGYRK